MRTRVTAGFFNSDAKLKVLAGDLLIHLRELVVMGHNLESKTPHAKQRETHERNKSCKVRLSKSLKLCRQNPAAFLYEKNNGAKLKT